MILTIDLHVRNRYGPPPESFLWPRLSGHSSHLFGSNVCALNSATSTSWNAAGLRAPPPRGTGIP
ncbi:hypothetical protein JTE90_016402, partial [Oedothorax gibbosus]